MSEHDDDARYTDESAAVDWEALGTFAPHVPPGMSARRRDLGAGGSLRQDADRARTLRRMAARGWHRPEVQYGSGIVLLMVGIGAFFAASLATTITGLLLVLAGTAVLTLATRAYLTTSTAEKRLRLRARTEQTLARELDTLAASGWVLLHDRVLSGGDHRLSHVAVGPAGVFVLSPLPETGPLHIVGHILDGEDYRVLYAGSLHLGTWLHTRAWEVTQLEHALAQAHQDTVWAGPTAAVAVEVTSRPWWDFRRAVPRASGPSALPYEWQHVCMRPVGAVVSMLQHLPAPLSRTTVAALAATVEELCPPAGRAEDLHSTLSSNSLN